MGTNDYKKRQRAKKFIKQEGKCFWCKCDMILMYASPPNFRPDNLCTLDHLRDRFHPDRQEPNDGVTTRYVAACNKCNFERGRESQAAQPVEHLRERSGRLGGDPKKPLVS